MVNNVMVDLETMGTGANSAIIAIGAVKFSLTEGITDRFYSIIKLQSCLDIGLTVDGDTIEWWLKQGENARIALVSDQAGYIPGVLPGKFTPWLGKDAVVWGNGASFDNTILANAYSKIGTEQPWKFWNDRCYRTIKSLYPDVEMDRKGTHHNALDDAETQALHLIEIAKKYNLGI